MASIDVHLGAGAEIDAAGRLTRAAYVDDGLIPAEDDYVSRLGDSAGRAADAELWVATEAGTVLGCVTFCPEGSPWRELAGPGEGEFRMLAVSPAARGRGVGEALVRRCLSRARELGLGSMILCSMDQMAPAHRLYARLGFERSPEQDWSPARDVCLWAFRLDL